MALQPKTEPGYPPISSQTENRDFRQMSIHELVNVLRRTVKCDDYDKVEEALLFEDAQRVARIGSLEVEVEVQRMAKIQAQEELKKMKELCEKGKKAQENYEALMAEVKKNFLPEKKNTVKELSTKINGLELENLKLMQEKQKWEDDRSVVDELRKKVAEFEDGKVEKGSFEEIRRKCRELEDENKRNLETIEELKNVNAKLMYVKLKGEAKFAEIIDRIVKLEEETRVLQSAFDAEKDGKEKSEADDDPKVPVVAVKEEVDVGASAPPLQKGNDAHQSLGASLARGNSRLAVDVIEIVDSDDDGNDEGIHVSLGTQPQTVETLKRKISYPDSEHSSSSSSSLHADNLPLSNKRFK